MISLIIDRFSNWYAEPLFLEFPIALVILSTVSFLTFALPTTLMDALNPEFAVVRRIQRDHRSTITIRKYLRFFVQFLPLQFAVAVLAWPLLRFTRIHSGPMPSVGILVLQLLFFLMIDDFLFYWVHRALHLPWFYRRIHAIHHRARVSAALTATYFHPVEYLLVTLSFLAGPALLGAHLPTLYLWVVLRQLIAVDGHSGYFFPGNPLHLIPFYDGSIYHDFHHAKVVGNYGLFFSYLDRIFHTFSEGYTAYRDRFHP